MSTNSNCLFTQVKTNEWFYILEDYNAPKNAWDWREHATAYGPFSSLELAQKHLHDNHANPGGWCTEELPEGVVERELKGILKDLIENARKASVSRSQIQRFGTGIFAASRSGFRRY